MPTWLEDTSDTGSTLKTLGNSAWYESFATFTYVLFNLDMDSAENFMKIGVRLKDVAKMFGEYASFKSCDYVLTYIDANSITRGILTDIHNMNDEKINNFAVQFSSDIHAWGYWVTYAAVTSRCQRYGNIDLGRAVLPTTNSSICWQNAMTDLGILFSSMPLSFAARFNEISPVKHSGIWRIPVLSLNTNGACINPGNGALIADPAFPYLGGNTPPAIPAPLFIGIPGVKAPFQSCTSPLNTAAAANTLGPNVPSGSGNFNVADNIYNYATQFNCGLANFTAKASLPQISSQQSWILGIFGYNTMVMDALFGFLRMQSVDNSALVTTMCGKELGGVTMLAQIVYTVPPTTRQFPSQLDVVQVVDSSAQPLGATVDVQNYSNKVIGAINGYIPLSQAEVAAAICLCLQSVQITSVNQRLNLPTITKFLPGQQIGFALQQNLSLEFTAPNSSFIQQFLKEVEEHHKGDSTSLTMTRQELYEARQSCIKKPVMNMFRKIGTTLISVDEKVVAKGASTIVGLVTGNVVASTATALGVKYAIKTAKAVHNQWTKNRY